MRCIFCKKETTGSEPREHIIPESLGNSEHVLRPGLVCGKCNNYFASKVEKAVMELPSVVVQRFEQHVPNKKGRISSNQGLILEGQIPVEAIRDEKDGSPSIGLPDDPIAIRKIHALVKGTLILPASMPLLPSRVVSRFIAKIAIEALAYRLDRADCSLEECIDNEKLDQIRNHARYGKIDDWPVHIRQIYDADTLWNNGSSAPYQIVHEFDFLFIENGEMYFVVAFFGQEFTINIGGPSIKGFEERLRRNDHVSPLQPDL